MELGKRFRAPKTSHDWDCSNTTWRLSSLQQSAALQRLQEELAGLREQLRQQRSGAQADLEAALAAKDAIINQLRRELRDQQDKLDVSVGRRGGVGRCGGVCLFSVVG